MLYILCYDLHLEGSFNASNNTFLLVLKNNTIEKLKKIETQSQSASTKVKAQTKDSNKKVPSAAKAEKKEEKK